MFKFFCPITVGRYVNCNFIFANSIVRAEVWQYL